MSEDGQKEMRIGRKGKAERRRKVYKHKKRKSINELPLFCTPLGIRTLDPLIKSQLLYQLS